MLIEHYCCVFSFGVSLEENALYFSTICKVYTGRIEGNRAQDRSQATWRDNIMDILQERSMTLIETARKANKQTL